MIMSRKQWEIRRGTAIGISQYLIGFPMSDMFGFLALARQVEGLGSECWEVAESPAYDGIRHQSVGLDSPHTHAEMLPPSPPRIYPRCQ